MTVLLFSCSTYEKKLVKPEGLDPLEAPEAINNLSKSIQKDSSQLKGMVRVILSDEQFDYSYKFESGELILDARYGTALVEDFSVLWFILGIAATLAATIIVVEYCRKKILESKEEQIRLQLKLAEIDFKKTELLMKNQEL